MVLKPSSIDNHLEEGSDSIQIDQIRDQLVGLCSNHEILEPREVSTTRQPDAQHKNKRTRGHLGPQ